MKNRMSLFMALTAAIPSIALADIQVYGKANLSLEMVEEGSDSYTALESNSSRLGFKGSEAINENLKAIYQLEYEVNFDDNQGDVFRQRNIFIGLKGDFGQVIGGHFDTPLKVAQNKVDLFNDLRGDIKNYLTPNDNRTNNTVMYTTPNMQGFSADIAYIASEDEARDDGASLSLTYDQKNLYLALAFDQDVEAQDSEAIRAAIQYQLAGWQLGMLWEQYEAPSAEKKDAWLVSARYSINDKWKVKGQYGESEIGFRYDGTATTDESDSMSVGVDYSISKNLMAYSYYTVITARDEGIAEDVVDDQYFGIGLDYRF